MDAHDEWAISRPWRVGRKVGRTIYAVYGDEPHDRDRLIGMMDSRAIAAAVVEAHNRMVADAE